MHGVQLLVRQEDRDRAEEVLGTVATSVDPAPADTAE
jgi:hypothetical protein